MTLLLLQMTIVLLTTLLCGWIARKFGQARVIGEIVGGIFLGPSVFGRIAPHASASLFPQNSLGPFDVLSTVGLILFLFLIGSQLDYEHLQRHRTTAALTSGLSVVLPFLIALAVAPSLRVRFAPTGVGSLPFALFLGVSMSITAFPVLARILEERQMQSTPLGTTALMCAAVDDVSAWTLLAVALTLIPHSAQSMSLPYRLLWLCVYIAVMVVIVRPLGKWLVSRQNTIALSYEVLGIIVVIVLGSAAATEAIGVHPLFGAFLGGVCFPRIQHWQSTVRTSLEMVVSVLLLPFFFALTGMRTRLDLLHGANMWFWTAVVLVASVAGKMGGAVFASRWTGQTWKNAWALGALLNTRGLVELIVLNIAYNAHVFSPALFTMLVVMALITTMMTTPILNLLGIRGSVGQTRDPAVIQAAWNKR
jgi:Kef-type K+ transport system membrane component KefB